MCSLAVPTKVIFFTWWDEDANFVNFFCSSQSNDTRDQTDQISAVFFFFFFSHFPSSSQNSSSPNFQEEEHSPWRPLLSPPSSTQRLRTLRCSWPRKPTLDPRTCRFTWSLTSGRPELMVSMSSTLARLGMFYFMSMFYYLPYDAYRSFALLQYG